VLFWLACLPFSSNPRPGLAIVMRCASQQADCSISSSKQQAATSDPRHSLSVTDRYLRQWDPIQSQ
jgi:hypothetical protein